MKRFPALIAVATLAMATSLPAWAQNPAAIKANVERLTAGKVKVDQVQATPAPGIFQVISEGEIFYTDATGRYGLVGGALVDMQTQQDLTAPAVEKLTAVPFASLPLTHLWAVLYFAGVASMILGLLGIMAGLWAEKFDHMAAVTNFVIMPLTFLSGTFYLVDRLPEPFRSASHYNPFFYLIDGFRAGFIGHAEGSLMVGVVMSAVLTVLMGAACWLVFRSGWRLKS